MYLTHLCLFFRPNLSDPGQLQCRLIDNFDTLYKNENYQHDTPRLTHTCVSLHPPSLSISLSLALSLPPLSLSTSLSLLLTELIQENDELKEKEKKMKQQIDMLETNEKELAKKNHSNMKVDFIIKGRLPYSNLL